MNSLQYNWKYRIYKNGSKQSESFDDVVGGNVRVRILGNMITSHTGLKTPFSGIGISPYRDSPEFTAFLRTLKPGRMDYNRIWNEFKQSIFEAWMPDKIHIIGASSGYDSRLIAKAIQELTQKHGKDWIGETWFIENGGESKGFEAIMKALKWKNYIIWKPDYTFEYFQDIHERFNGICAYPVNQWYDYYVNQWYEEDIQYISGYGGNVADAMNPTAWYMHPVKRRKSVHWILNWYFGQQYYYQLSAFKQPKYSFHPFWSWRFIKAASNFQPKLTWRNKKHGRTSRYLSNIFVPECRHIQRLDTTYVIANKDRLLKKEVIDKLYEWYISTDYGGNNRIEPSQNIEYNRWWLQFCIASYAEKKNNINIK